MDKILLSGPLNPSHEKTPTNNVSVDRQEGNKRLLKEDGYAARDVYAHRNSRLACLLLLSSLTNDISMVAAR